MIGCMTLRLPARSSAHHNSVARVGAAPGQGEPDLGYRRVHGELRRLGDRDTKLTAAFDAVFATEGIEMPRTPVRAPRANAYAERWVGTVGRECLDRMLVAGRRHLVSVLGEHAEHYNAHRPHRALGQALRRQATAPVWSINPAWPHQ